MNAVSPNTVAPDGSPVASFAPRRPVAVWPWPIVLGMLTTFGQPDALPPQLGIWLALSWAALSMPLIVTVICLIRAWRGPSSKGGLS